MHALSATSGSIKFSADTSAVVLHFVTCFLAKNQIPSVAGVLMEIPALPCSRDGIDSYLAGLSGSVGCAVRLETRRSRVQPPLRSATFFRGD